nr:hypothetical protein [Tanacetum cinerariifolium]
MATTIEQQVALDEALIPNTQRLRIGRSNFRLPSDIQSKESTLQVVYYVLRRCPLFKAFLVTADVLEIYMQEFWATAYVHQHSIRFKLDKKNHIVNLETFRDMLHICHRIPGQSFDELPFEEEILEFLRTMATIIEQQVALDEALIPNTQRLRIGRSNFRLPSDIQSKELTLQLVYDVLRRCPFFKVFLVTADVPEVYMQEFWATTYVHQCSIRFKMNNKKHTVDLESFREMLYICPRIPGQAFAELPFEEEILEFIRFLGHGATIRTLTEININKLYQPWRSFAAIINKCLTGKSSGYNSLRLSQAQILWGLYHKRSIDYAFLIWEDFMYQVENKNQKKNTSITPPTATTTPTTTVVVTLRLTAAAKGKQPAKAKSPSDPSEVARTEAQQLKIVLRRSRQQTHISQLGGSSTDKGTGSKLGVLDVPSDDSEEELSWNFSDDDEQDDTERGGDDDEESESNEESDSDETREDESFDPIPRTPEDSEDDGNGKEDQGLRISKEERLNEEEETEELYRYVNINQRRGIQATLDVEDSHVTLTPVHPDGQQESSSVLSQFVTSMLNPPSDAVQLQTNRLHDSYQRENDEFLQTIDENMKRIIKEQVKSQVKEQVSRILPRIEQSVNAQLEAEFLTRSSHSSRTSYAVAADLSEIELKKILIEKMEGNKSIQR